MPTAKLVPGQALQPKFQSRETELLQEWLETVAIIKSEFHLAMKNGKLRDFGDFIHKELTSAQMRVDVLKFSSQHLPSRDQYR